MRTLKVQSQTNGLTGRLTALSEREQGADEEQREERTMKVSTQAMGSGSIQTEVTYTFKTKNPRHQEKETV